MLPHRFFVQRIEKNKVFPKMRIQNFLYPIHRLKFYYANRFFFSLFFKSVKAKKQRAESGILLQKAAVFLYTPPIKNPFLSRAKNAKNGVFSPFFIAFRVFLSFPPPQIKPSEFFEKIMVVFRFKKGRILPKNSFVGSEKAYRTSTFFKYSQNAFSKRRFGVQFVHFYL